MLPPETISTIAAVGTLLSGVGAAAAWRNSYKVKQQTKPSNGQFLASYVEGTAADVREMRGDVRELRDMMVVHITDRGLHSFRDRASDG